MEWWLLGLNYLKVAIWPALWLIVALLFRQSIRDFVDRLRTFEGGGVKLSAVDGADIAETKVSEALRDSDPEVREAVDNAFDDARATLRAVDEPWALDHFSNDAYMLKNISGSAVYDVEIDAGDFITRGDLLLPRVGASERIKLLLVRSLATASDSITVKWSIAPHSAARQSFSLFVPPRPKR